MRSATAVAGVLATIAVTSVIAFVLASPHAAPAEAAVRALADCAAVGSLGLSFVGALDTGRRRDELVAAAVGPLIAVSAAWLVAEVVRQALSAAQAAAVPLTRVGMGTVTAFTLHTTAGRAGLLSAVAAAVVCATASSGRRSAAVTLSAAGAAAIGIAARAVSGHLSHDSWGTLAAVVHVLAAAVWCGGLAALALTVRHRGQWARVLPRFSALALVCVLVLLASGIVSTMVATESLAPWYQTGWGRLLLAKVVLVIVLVALGWRNRTVWLPAARAHQASAERSQGRSVAELALMVAALTMAAALVVTG
jgi:copper resistance protein D